MSAGLGQERTIISVTEVPEAAAEIDDLDSLSTLGRFLFLIPVDEIILRSHELLNRVVGVPVLQVLYDHNNFGHEILSKAQHRAAVNVLFYWHT